jgi:hypothetical protein
VTRRLLLALALALCPHAASPSEVPPGFRLFLIGDAGEPAPEGEPVLRALTVELAREPETSWVVFLGDNLYPKGLPEPEDPRRAEMEARIGAQVEAVISSGARGIFIPGNHDWYGQGPEGAAVRRLESWVEAHGEGRVEWLPDGGCPGPVVRDDLHPALRLVLIDTQWWFEASRPPDCAPGTETDVLEAVETALDGAGERTVVVLGHHPLVSRGVHGGHFDLADHVFPARAWKPWAWIPLPVVGSLYPVSRWAGISNQDFTSGTYARLRASLAEAMATRPPLVYASGHEHNLQVLDGAGARFQLVSGAGIHGHALPVDRDNAHFAAREAGFMSLAREADNWVVTVYVVDADATARPAHTQTLTMESPP